MIALLRKEINTFFATTVGYLVIGLFLVLNGLFLWVFKGQFNILESGFADLSPFFQIAPWILLLIIPAVTMRSIADEKKQGTLELLVTKPISLWKLVVGKFLGSYTLMIIMLVPSILYVITIQQLGDTTNLDLGSTIGSYIGLLSLCASYTAIGTFTSAITQNQIVAFLIAVLVSFILFFGCNAIAEFGSLPALDNFIAHLGMQLHYNRISQGVIDTRDLLYFLSICILFLVAAIALLSKKTGIQKFKIVLITSIVLLLLPTLSNRIYTRFDLTKDHRFTLSEATKKLIEEATMPVTIDVLLDGDFPPEFRKLQSETKQLLDEINALNPNIQYILTNPLKEEVLREETITELQQFGLTPMEVSVQQDGKTEIETIVPWAIMSSQKNSIKIPLIKHTIGASSEERVSNSIQQLEYVFADGLRKLLHPKQHKIAVLKGNGQLSDIHIADFIKTLQEYYFVGAFTLDSVTSNPQKTAQDLQKFDLVINAKPKQAFSDAEKYVLDQFSMQGGKSAWLVESVAMELDSLFNPKGATLAFVQDLRLNDLFFSYGVRINPVLINDLYSAPIVLASGQGNETQFSPYPWFYASLTKPEHEHPIVKNIEAVKFDFPAQIDTLKNNIQKTVLLTSSKSTKIEGVPKEIRLDIIKTKPNMNTYTAGPQSLAVLLEGNFKSVYKGRVKPFQLDTHKDQSEPTKMVIIADGDVIKNKTKKGKPLPLGHDPYLKLNYGNKEFLLNTVNYLLDDSGLIGVRSKEISIPFLDIEKVVAQKTLWQTINIIVPLLLLGIFGALFTWMRRRKYVK